MSTVYQRRDVPPDPSHTHTFVVRLWREEPTVKGAPRWRGHITHLLGDERRYVESIEQIHVFIDRFVCPDPQVRNRANEA
jgi:hypothetical protein